MSAASFSGMRLQRGVLRANDGDSAVMADCYIGQKPKV